MKKFKNQKLSTGEQRNVLGGVKPGLPPNPSSCPTGICAPLFFQDSTSDCCAIPGPNGEVCYGTVRGRLCCL